MNDETGKLLLSQLQTATGVGADDINAAITELWNELQTNPRARELAAKDAGVDPVQLMGREPPVTARQGASEFGVATTILIFIGLRVAESLIDETVSKIYETIIWPRLQAVFGKKVSRN